MLAPITRLSLPAEVSAELPLNSSEPPPLGNVDGTVLPLWPGTRLESACVLSYTAVMVLTHDRAVDKDLNRRVRHTERTQGIAAEQAYETLLAQRAFDNLIQVAPIRPVNALPPHVPHDGEELVLLEPPILDWPAGEGPWVVDLSRMTTISARAADLRYAIADAEMKHQLQTALCYYYASRSTRLGEKLKELFERPIENVEALKPQPPQEPRRGKPMRIRVWWEGGQKADLDAVFDPPLPQDDEPRPERTAGPPGRSDPV